MIQYLWLDNYHYINIIYQLSWIIVNFFDIFNDSIYLLKLYSIDFYIINNLIYKKTQVNVAIFILY